MGAISKIFFKFNGGGPRFCTGAIDVNKTIDCPVMPSMKRFALAKIDNRLISHPTVMNANLLFLTDGQV